MVNIYWLPLTPTNNPYISLWGNQLYVHDPLCILEGMTYSLPQGWALGFGQSALAWSTVRGCDHDDISCSHNCQHGGACPSVKVTPLRGKSLENFWDLRMDAPKAKTSPTSGLQFCELMNFSSSLFCFFAKYFWFGFSVACNDCYWCRPFLFTQSCYLYLY